MLFGDLVRDGQAEAGAAPHRFRGEERIEDRLRQRLGHARPAVAYRQHRAVALDPVLDGNARLGHLLDRVERVLHEVHHHLLHMAGPPPHRQMGLARDLDRHRSARAAQDPSGGHLRHRHKVEALHLARSFGGEPPQVLDDVAHPLGPVARALHRIAQVAHLAVELQLLAQPDQRLARGTRLHLLEILLELGGVAAERMGIGIDEADRIVQLMRHAREGGGRARRASRSAPAAPAPPSARHGSRPVRHRPAAAPPPTGR